MPLTTQAMAGTGPALPANLLGANAATGISNAIGRITAGNMFGAVGGIHGLQDIFGWRVDRQNGPGGVVNISIQRNGVGAPSTVASVFVSGNYNQAGPGANAGAGAQVAYAARLRELERAVRRGLEQSFASYTVPLAPPNANARVITRYQVNGQFSG